MILGSINNIKNLADLVDLYGVSTDLAKCISSLLSLYNLSKQNEFKISTEVFGKIEFSSLEEANKRTPEFHQHFIDVHLVLEGSECIGFGGNISTMSINDMQSYKYDPSNDLGFLATDKIQYVTLLPGNFAIFYPNELHKPLCQTSLDDTVKKMILKVNLDSLKK